MVTGLLQSISWSRRLGGAVRLGEGGRLEDARDALSSLRDDLRAATTPDARASVYGTRLMALAHLAGVASRLADAALVRGCLEEWTQVFDAAARSWPRLTRDRTIAAWDKWARSSLAWLARDERERQGM